MTKHKVEIYASQPDNAFIAADRTRQQAIANLETAIECGRAIHAVSLY